MIKHLLLPLLLSATLFSACSKDDGPTTVTPTTSAVAVSGVADLNVPRGRTATLTLAVSATGTAQSTTLTISGLPSGVTGSFSPATGTPGFSSTLTLTAASSAAVGNSSTATITATTPDGLEKKYTLAVTVTAPTNCAQDLVGTYTASDVCTTGSATYTAAINLDPSQPSTRVIIGNFANSSIQVYADIDCALGIITIPTQALGSLLFVVGGGTYTSTSLSYSYYVYDNNGNQVANCQSNMSR